jgi:hypothetical protein
LGGNLQPDPGHKAEVTIDGIKFSCPKGFTLQIRAGAPVRALRVWSSRRLLAYPRPMLHTGRSIPPGTP